MISLRHAALLFIVPVLQNPGPQVPRGDASVEGNVVSSSTGAPIPSATIELTPVSAAAEGVFQFGTWTTAPGPHYTAVTGADGRFVVPALPAGTYRLYATQASGFVLSEYGQRSIGGRGQPLKLTEGQKLRDIQLSMPPAGAISGRILDGDGEPVVRARVAASRLTYTEGRRVLRTIQSVLTDDLGDYRLFWLPPGSYYVSARIANAHEETAEVLISPPGAGGSYETAYPAQARRTLQEGKPIEEVLVPVYYPGTIDSKSASSVALRPGEHLGGIDFSTVRGRVRAFHIRGMLVSAAPPPSPNGFSGAVGGPQTSPVLLSPRALDIDIPVSSGVIRAGRFDISNVIAGSYYLLALAGGGITIQTVEVGDADVENLQVLTGTQGLRTFPGRVAIEGDNGAIDRRELTKLRLTVQLDPNIAVLPPPPPPAPGAPPSGSVSAAGEFTLNLIPPGDYRLVVNGIPPGLYLKSARLGNTDLLADGLHVEKPPDAPIQVVVSARPGSVNGRVLNEKQLPAANVTVALVPDVARRKRFDLYRDVTTGEDGVFQFDGLAEGDYKIFAWEEVETSAWLNAEFLQPFETRGKAVHIDEATHREIDVTMIGVQK